MDRRPDEKFRQGFTGARAVAGGTKTSNRFPCSLPDGGRAGSLNGVRLGLDWWVRPEGWLRGAAPCLHLRGAVCRDRARDPAFAPGTLEVAVGFWPFGALFVICPNCPRVRLFLVPYSFFVFCCWKRCLSRCKHCSKGAHAPASLSVNSSHTS